MKDVIIVQSTHCYIVDRDCAQRALHFIYGKSVMLILLFAVCRFVGEQSQCQSDENTFEWIIYVFNVYF